MRSGDIRRIMLFRTIFWRGDAFQINLWRRMLIRANVWRGVLIRMNLCLDRIWRTADCWWYLSAGELTCKVKLVSCSVMMYEVYFVMRMSYVLCIRHAIRLWSVSAASCNDIWLGKINPCLLLGMKKINLQLCLEWPYWRIPAFDWRILSWGSLTSAWG